jgi:hypothetical protein
MIADDLPSRRGDFRDPGGLRLTPWLCLQPDQQYLIHPSDRTERAAAIVVGGRGTVSLWSCPASVTNGSSRLAIG